MNTSNIIESLTYDSTIAEKSGTCEFHHGYETPEQFWERYFGGSLDSKDKLEPGRYLYIYDEKLYHPFQKELEPDFIGHDNYDNQINLYRYE